MTDMEYQLAQNILSELEKYLLGKRKPLEYALTCLLVEGHLLIEDVPGVGKTTLINRIMSTWQAKQDGGPLRLNPQCQID